MKLLVPMTYYRPYVSGPIIYVENLARELIRRGHQVTILTSHYDPGLPLRETTPAGLQIVRVPVLFRISKGVIMPAYPLVAAGMIAEHDVVAIQIPQFEAPLLAALARQIGRPATMTYHCDVQLPSGLFNRLVDRIVLAGNDATARLVERVVAYTRDYAEHSPLMSRHLDKVTVIPPPVEMAPPAPAELDAFVTRHGVAGRPVVGICGRFATEKGFEHLIGTIPLLLEEFPDLLILHAGEFENVIGEQAYRDRLRPLLERYADHWRSLGVIGGGELAAFFTACDVTVLPSLNRTESFGFVQVESMLNGTPVVASNLPGVRVPVQTTGMGRVTPIGETAALAADIAAILRDPATYAADRSRVEASYSVRRSADDYERLFGELIEASRRPPPLRAHFALLVALAAFLAALLRPPHGWPQTLLRRPSGGHDEGTIHLPERPAGRHE